VTELPTPRTRLLALLGDPVHHSLSPRFQNAAIRAAGLDGCYLALRCAAGDVPGLIRGIARAGGGGNVTIPHKEVAAASVEEATPAVHRTGACNTYWLQDGRIHGDNTDVAGVDRSIRELLGVGPSGLSVLLVGAGGAARAALCALLDGGASRVTLLNRSAERTASLLALFPEAAGRLHVVPDRSALERERFDLAVNATSLGLRADDPLPIPPAAVHEVAAGLDLVYDRGSTTPWVRALRDAGIAAADGRGMLLHQGAAAFERWWGVTAPLQVMRESLADDPPALAEQPR
jgi:shikimate dehydrogenase